MEPMPTRRRIDDERAWKVKPCRHPDHGVPKHRCFPPGAAAGTYEHTCPACGHKTIFVVPEIHWKQQRESTSPMDWSYRPWLSEKTQYAVRRLGT